MYSKLFQYFNHFMCVHLLSPFNDTILHLMLIHYKNILLAANLHLIMNCNLLNVAIWTSGGEVDGIWVKMLIAGYFCGDYKISVCIYLLWGANGVRIQILFYQNINFSTERIYCQFQNKYP